MFRYLHFSNTLQDLITAAPIDSQNAKLVILIHGWNPTSENENTASDAWATMIQSLRHQLYDLDYGLVFYSWKTDADTGNKWPGSLQNGMEAAEIGHRHGQHLGELLSARCPSLKSVHFIAHSAGAWVARAAMKQLLTSNPSVHVQVTLLDPFIPAESLSPVLRSSLDDPAIESMASQTDSDRIEVLENYYSVYALGTLLDLTGLGTAQTFRWRATDVNVRVDGYGWEFYSDHAGPVTFYADTVVSVETGVDPLGLSYWAGENIGWKNSLFRRDAFRVCRVVPSWKSNPTGTPITLTAKGIYTRGAEITAVRFYRDRNRSLTLDDLNDDLLGSGVNRGAEWTLDTKADWGVGTQRVFAVARASDGTWSQPGFVDITIADSSPSASLLQASVAPGTGDPTTTFQFSVSYVDRDGAAPAAANLYLDGVATPLSLVSGSPGTGTYSCRKAQLPIGSHTYYFAFQTQRGVEVRLPASGAFGGPSVGDSAPSILITTPTMAAQWTTAQNVIHIHGICSDSVVSVRWVNSATGNSGSATPPQAWSTQAIPLDPGPNEIRITASDGSGASTFATLTVIYSETSSSQTFDATQIAGVFSGIPDKPNPTGTLYVGFDTGQLSQRERMFAEFGGLASLPGGTTVLTAIFQATIGDVTPAGAASLDVDIHPVTTAWSAPAVTWNKQPGIDSTRVWHGSIQNVLGSLVSWDITGLVRTWMTGGIAPHGLVLMPSHEGGPATNDRGLRNAKLKLTYQLETQPPEITITEPNPGRLVRASAAVISVRGTASDAQSGLDSVRWSNETTKAGGSASGGGSWDTGPVALVVGTNLIRVVAVDRAGNSASAVLQVSWVPPGIATAATALSVTLEENGIPSTTDLELWNAGDGSVRYAIRSGAAWITFSPSEGSLTSTPSQIQLRISPAGLEPGLHSAAITILNIDGSQSPIAIPISATILGRVGTPTFNPTPGRYAIAPLRVSLGSATSGAAIHFTVDGSTPTEDSPLFDGAPVGLTRAVTIRARAWKSGLVPSAEAAGTYVIDYACAADGSPAIEPDPYFTAPRFTRQVYPSRVVHDGSGRLLWTWHNGGRLDGANGVRLGEVIRTDAHGTVDTTFVPGPELHYALGLVADPVHGIYVGASVPGETDAGEMSLGRVVRLLDDGRIDASYRSPKFAERPRFMALQPDGKLIVGVMDSTDGTGSAKEPISITVRLLQDGSLDPGFAPPAITPGTVGFPSLVGVDPIVDGEGRILIAGGFVAVNGVPRRNVARLMPDGTLDPSFVPSGIGATSRYARGLAVQSNGRIVLAGRLRRSTAPGESPDTSEYAVLGLRPDGSLDPTFHLVHESDLGLGSPFGSGARHMRLVANDGIIISGGTVAKLVADGSVDATFRRPVLSEDPSGSFGFPLLYWLEALPSGQLVLPVLHDSLGDIRVNGDLVGAALALDASGLAAVFTAPAFEEESFPTEAAYSPRGGLVLSGSFDRVDGQSRALVARANLDGTVDGAFALSDTSPNAAYGAILDLSQSPLALFVRGASIFYPTNLALSRMLPNGDTDAGFAVAAPLSWTLHGTSPDGFETEASYLADCRAIMTPAGLVVAINGEFNLALNRPCAIRLLGDGRADPSFVGPRQLGGVFSSSADGSIEAIVVGQLRPLCAAADGRVACSVTEGPFAPDANHFRHSVRVLSTNGSWADSFRASIMFEGPNRVTADVRLVTNMTTRGVDTDVPVISVASNPIGGAAFAADGSLVVVGSFWVTNGAPYRSLIRFAPSGEVDARFKPGAGAARNRLPNEPASVQSVAIDGFGSILIAGDFDRYDGISCPGVARIRADGSLDPCFSPDLEFAPDQQRPSSILLDEDGGILLLGSYRQRGRIWPEAVLRLRPQAVGEPPAPSAPVVDLTEVALLHGGASLVGQTLSADGMAVAGTMVDGADYFWWARGVGLRTVGDPLPEATHRSVAISGDSTRVFVAAGNWSADAREFLEWLPSASDTMTSAGDISPGKAFRLSAADSTGDVVVGWLYVGYDDENSEAVRWRRGKGFTPLGFLAGDARSQARATSRDGAYVAGYSAGARVRAVRWTASGQIRALESVAGFQHTVATAISADGKVVVGYSHGPVGGEACLWLDGFGGRTLGVLPGYTVSDASAVTSDGTRVFGNCANVFTQAAFVWDSDHGMRDLKTVLWRDYGIPLPGYRLLHCIAVSDDGNRILAAATRGVSPERTLLIDASPRFKYTRDRRGLTLEWDSDLGAPALETSTALGTGADWREVEGAPSSTGGRKSLTLTPVDGQRFYRLRRR